MAPELPGNWDGIFPTWLDDQTTKDKSLIDKILDIIFPDYYTTKKKNGDEFLTKK